MTPSCCLATPPPPTATTTSVESFSSSSLRRKAIKTTTRKPFLYDPLVDDNNNNNATSSSSLFPQLNDTIEMSELSYLIYGLRSYDNDTYACELINQHKYQSFFLHYPKPTFLTCHWYQHNRQDGSQVMIVSRFLIKTATTNNTKNDNNNNNYIAVVFAGTDDVKTSLTDLDMLMKPYGPIPNDTTTTTPSTNNNTDPRYVQYNNITLPNPDIRIHAGFNYNVFHDALLGQIIARVEDILLLQQEQTSTATSTATTKIFTTGHSLGAANSVLTAVGMAIHYTRKNHHNNHNYNYNYNTPLVTSLNFGCPRIGNSVWRDFLQNMTTTTSTASSPLSLSIWRVVLGWDIIPRLPKLLYHEGHTIQLEWMKNNTNNKKNNNSSISSSSIRNDDENNKNDNDTEDLLKHDDENNDDDDDDKLFNFQHWWSPSDYDDNATTITDIPMSIAYYQHYGDETKGFAGVPFGWFSKPFIWVPGAMLSHRIQKYIEFLKSIREYNQLHSSTDDNSEEDTTTTNIWVHEFVPVSSSDNNNNHTDYNDDDVIPDDDVWVNPPEYATEES